jgi:hypothetical protein
VKPSAKGRVIPAEPLDDECALLRNDHRGFPDDENDEQRQEKENN